MPNLESSYLVDLPAYAGMTRPNMPDEDGDIAYDGSDAGAYDYAEMFEWEDGNSDNEDRVGYSVSLVGDKIKIAEEGEMPIGIVSVKPAVCGDSPLYWKDKWKRDEWGRRILNEVQCVKWEYQHEKEPAIEAVEAVEAQDAVYETVTKQRQKVVVNEVEEEVSSTEIVLEDGKYVQKTTTETVTKEVSESQWEDVSLYGEDGEQLMSLVSEAIEAKEAVLDEDGNEIEEAVDAQDAVYEGITHRIPEMEDYEEEQLVSEAVEAEEAVEPVECVEEVFYKSITMSGIIPVLIEAVKELSAKVAELESA